MRVLIVAVAVLLAGCGAAPEGVEQPEPTDDVDHADETDLDVNETPRPKPTTPDAPPGPGALRFIVHDVAQRPLPDAAVLAREGDLFGTTDADGTVEFEDLEPGLYLFRIQREAYRVLEANVTVEADILKTVRLVLNLQEGLLTPPHFHDYWNGRDEVLLFDEAWDVACYGSFGGLFGVCTENGAYEQGNRDFKFPDGATIWPGTGQLVLTVSWEGTRDDVAVVLDTPASDPENVVTNGEPSVYDVAPEMWDPPHAGTSLSYLAFSPNAVSYHGVYEQVQIQVRLVRGDEPLPFDPPHPDLWEGAKQKRMDDKSFSFGYVRWGTMEARLPDEDGHTPNGHRFPEGRIVIPGTQEVVWRVWSNETLSSNGVVLEFTADVDQQFGPDVWHTRQADLDQGDYLEWRVPVPEAWVDDIYATSSTWAWKLAPAPVVDADTFHTMAWSADVHVIIDIVR